LRGRLYIKVIVYNIKKMASGNSDFECKKESEKARGNRESGGRLQKGLKAFKYSCCKKIESEGGRKGRRKGLERRRI
jgi:hypothetical protein